MKTAHSPLSSKCQVLCCRYPDITSLRVSGITFLLSGILRPWLGITRSAENDICDIRILNRVLLSYSLSSFVGPLLHS